MLARAEVERAAGSFTFREDFSLAQWTAALGFGRPAAVDGFYVEWEGCCDLYHHAARCRPPEQFLSPAQREAARREAAQGVRYTPQPTKALLDDDVDEEDEEDEEDDNEGDGDGDEKPTASDSSPIDPADGHGQDREWAAAPVEGPPPDADVDGLAEEGPGPGPDQQSDLSGSCAVDAAGFETAAAETQEGAASADLLQDMDFSQWVASKRLPPPSPSPSPAASISSPPPPPAAAASLTTTSDGGGSADTETDAAASSPAAALPSRPLSLSPPLPPVTVMSRKMSSADQHPDASEPADPDPDPVAPVKYNPEKRFKKISKEMRRKSVMWEPALQAFLDEEPN